MLERDIERYLREQVEAKGGRCLKWVSPACRGVPDRIMLLPGGKLAFVEVKSATGAVRPDQVRMLNRLRDLGFCAVIVRSKYDVDVLLTSPRFR